MTRALPAGSLVLAACAALAPPAWAQKPIPETVRMMEPHRLRIGDVVRAWRTAQGPPLQGTVVGVSTTTLTVTGRQEAELLEFPALARLEVRHTNSHVRRGALIGAGVGLLAGAFVVTRELLGHEVGGGERAAWTAGLGVAGAGAGAVVGRVARSVTWQPVDLVTLKPVAADARPALRLAWTVRF